MSDQPTHGNRIDALQLTIEALHTALRSIEEAAKQDHKLINTSAALIETKLQKEIQSYGAEFEIARNETHARNLVVNTRLTRLETRLGLMGNIEDRVKEVEDHVKYLKQCLLLSRCNMCHGKLMDDLVIKE